MDDVTLQIFLCVALEGMVKQRNVLFHFGGVVVQLKPMGGGIIHYFYCTLGPRGVYNSRNEGH